MVVSVVVAWMLCLRLLSESFFLVFCGVFKLGFFSFVVFFLLCFVSLLFFACVGVFLYLFRVFAWWLFHGFGKV